MGRVRSVPETAVATGEIPIDRRYLHRHGDSATRDAIRDVVKGVHFEFDADRVALRLAGPYTAHYAADADLHAHAAKIGAPPRNEAISTYRKTLPAFDLCLDDSWTGWFVAKRSDRFRERQAVRLIHLDDHTDMMPTLLTVEKGELFDPCARRAFDPERPDHWTAAIERGVLSIGNYLTALYFLKPALHVRHLYPRAEAAPLDFGVEARSIAYDPIPDHRFAGLELRAGGVADGPLGSYRSSSDPGELLDEPGGDAFTTVHIDLDYFINDFDGNPGSEISHDDAERRAIARQRMARFFMTLVNYKIFVDHWIIATSPGFCAARHWKWLLSELDRRITNLGHGSRT